MQYVLLYYILMEDDELNPTTNSLADLINWAKKGYIIMLSKKGSRISRYFSMPENVNSNKICQIVLSQIWGDLMHNGEWPWYIVKSGCIEFSDDEISSIGLRKCEYKIFYLD